MTQLEQELTALFEDAASRVNIRPIPVRSPRSVAINRILAAGVTAALVAGVALIATRLGSDSANRGGAITPTATQQLLDAVARTLSQPIRVAITFDSGQGAAQKTITEEDLDRQELVSYREGQPQLLIHGSRVYQGIGSIERQMFGLPASAQWVEVPASGQATAGMLQSMGGITGVQHLESVIGSGRVTVTELGTGTYRLSGPQNAPTGLTGADQETLHVNGAGLVDWVKLHADIPTGTGGPTMPVNTTARIRPLGHPLTLTLPDPSTVISRQAYEAATTSGSQNCSGGPSPAPSSPSNGGVYSSEIHCSFSVGGTTTLRAVKAHPKRH